MRRRRSHTSRAGASGHGRFDRIIIIIITAAVPDIPAAVGSRTEAFTGPGLDGAHRIVRTGPRRLWPALEATRRLRHDLDRPGPDRYGVVVTDTRSLVWLDSDTGWYRWPLPLV